MDCWDWSFGDGRDFLALGWMENVLNYLIWRQRIMPVIGIFISSEARGEEYAGNRKKAYSAFVIEEIFPLIRKKFRILTTPESVATFGISNGGNMALWLGLEYPEVFQNIAAQSSNVEDSIALGYQRTPFLKSQFYLDVGTYDIPVCLHLMDNLVNILETRGFVYVYKHYPEGHSWGSWRAHIDEGLEMFFPGPAAGTD